MARTSWTTGTTTRKSSVKNPDYKGNEQLKNDGVTFKVYTDDSAAYRDIQGGNLDVMDSVPPPSPRPSRLTRRSRLTPRPAPLSRPSPSRPPLTTSRTTRKASCVVSYSMAINRDQLIDKVLNGNATAATEFTSPKTPGYSDSLKGADNLKFNASKAKELWAKG